MIPVHLNENEEPLGSKMDISEAFLDSLEKVRFLLRTSLLTCQNAELYISAKIP